MPLWYNRCIKKEEMKMIDLKRLMKQICFYNTYRKIKKTCNKNNVVMNNNKVVSIDNNVLICYNKVLNCIDLNTSYCRTHWATGYLVAVYDPRDVVTYEMLFGDNQDKNLTEFLIDMIEGVNKKHEKDIS